MINIPILPDILAQMIYFERISTKKLGLPCCSVFLKSVYFWLVIILEKCRKTHIFAMEKCNSYAEEKDNNCY